MNRQITIIGIVMICLVIQASTAFAWGVVHEDNHITMLKGESRQFYTSLQNMVGNTNYTVAVELVQDAGISSINETSFELPINTRKLPVYIHLNIPNETEQESYVVTIRYRLSSDEQGQVSLGQEKIVNIYIEVIEPPEPEPEPEPPSPPPSTGGTVGGDSYGTGGSYVAPEPEQPSQPTEPEVEPDNGKPKSTEDVSPEPEVNDSVELQQQEPVAEITGQLASQEPSIFGNIWLWAVIIIVVGGLVGYMLLPRKEENETMPIPNELKFDDSYR